MRRLSIVAAAFLTVARGAARTTWIVDAAGGGHFTTIQTAIDAAADGDTILVRAGTCVEPRRPGRACTSPPTPAW